MRSSDAGASIDFVITIDGPAASGKSSVAQRVASALGVPYVSSGLLYRTATLAALREQADVDDEAAVLAAVERSAVRLEPRADGNRAWIGAEDVTAAAHSSAVDASVSRVAGHQRVREWVNAALKRLAAPFVAEGRDMGAAVFPGARVKLYLTASPRVRALRRTRERPEDLAVVEAALVERDRRDEANSRPAADATVIDTSELSLDAVVERSLGVVQEALA